jgi:hypothetical protein
MSYADSKTVTTPVKIFPSATKTSAAAVPLPLERTPAVMATPHTAAAKPSEREALRRELLKRILHNEATRRQQRATPDK